MTALLETILNEDYRFYIIAIISIFFMQIKQDSIAHILGGAIKKNKTRLKWINFLEYDEKINSCILNFKKMDAASFKSTIYGTGLGAITIVILVVVTPILYDTTQSPWSHLVWIHLNLVLTLIILRLNLSRNISNIKNCADFKDTKINFDAISSLTFTATAFVLIFLIIIAFDFVSRDIKIIDIINTAVLYFLVIVLLVLVILLSNKNYNDLTHKLESMLLEKYSETFPHIYVKADARELQGKVQDIFNDNFIVFGYNGLKIPVEWDKITSIKLSERADNEAETG